MATQQVHDDSYRRDMAPQRSEVVEQLRALNSRIDTLTWLIGILEVIQFITLLIFVEAAVRN